jgi:hypothetical protein
MIAELRHEIKKLSTPVERPTAAGGRSPTLCLPLRSRIGLPRRVSRALLLLREFDSLFHLCARQCSSQCLSPHRHPPCPADDVHTVKLAQHGTTPFRVPCRGLPPLGAHSHASASPTAASPLFVGVALSQLLPVPPRPPTMWQLCSRPPTLATVAALRVCFFGIV